MSSIDSVNISSYPRESKPRKHKTVLRLHSIFGSFIMTETSKKHALAFDLKQALTNLDFSHTHTDKVLGEFSNWVLVTYFDYVETSLLKEAILGLAKLEKSEKPLTIVELLDKSLAESLESKKTWDQLLGWTAAKIKDGASTDSLDDRLLTTVRNLPQHERAKLIRTVKNGQERSSVRRYSTLGVQKQEQSETPFMAG